MITFEKSAGFVVFREEEGKIKYLLLQYRKKHWGFPKGHIEKGETLIETALRETREETGISELEAIPGFKKSIYFYFEAVGNEREERIKSGKKIRIFKKATFFLGKTETEKIVLSHEQLDYQWLDFDEAVSMVTYQGDRSVLKKAGKYLDKYFQ